MSLIRATPSILERPPPPPAAVTAPAPAQLCAHPGPFGRSSRPTDASPLEVRSRSDPRSPRPPAGALHLGADLKPPPTDAAAVAIAEEADARAAAIPSWRAPRGSPRSPVLHAREVHHLPRLSLADRRGRGHQCRGDRRVWNRRSVLACARRIPVVPSAPRRGGCQHQHAVVRSLH